MRRCSMLVEFSGGSLNGQQRKIERFYEYINSENEIYYARAVNYKQLNWIYIWYQYQGNVTEQMVTQ